MDRQCSKNGKKMNAYRTLVGKFVGKMLLGRPRFRQTNDKKLGLRQVRSVGVDWIGLAQARTTCGLT
jgi:hypothetical protein